MEKQERQNRDTRKEEKRQSAEQLRESRGQSKATPLAAFEPSELRKSEALFHLGQQQLTELASLMGNQALLQLAQGGGEDPETFRFADTPAGESADKPNPIGTGEPGLYDAGNIGKRDGPPGAAVRPGGVRDRLAPGKSKDLFGTL